MPPIVETNEPPLIFSEHDYARFEQLGLRVFQVVFPMLGSINEKHGTNRGQTGMYTNKPYKTKANHVRKIIQDAVRDANWKTDKNDRYIVVLDFAFRTEVQQDLGNPEKPTIDEGKRQQLHHTRREKMTEEQIEQWFEDRPWAMWDDGQIFQEILIKHVNQPRDSLLGVMTIYAFHKDEYIAVPIHTLLHTYLLNRKEASSYVDPST